MIKVYRKTDTVKAEQFDGSDDMINKYHVRCDTGFLVFGDPLEYQTVPYQLEAPYGWENISIGDWIATNDDGKYFLITDDFNKTHAELPVIPKVWGDAIEEFKADHYKLSEMFDEWDWNYDEQELIARAWLDGYQVEEDK
ncbi:DUF1642 domain-containing protein [Lactiplantibacillus plantarum]|uniref:DUF1642 domain-containing protein n=1 Tax=Lactiplantibacillus plantarum TaxID=1590 RepID=UPI0012F9E58B|nr:DUF1642 domain-containing protein [Lactiplantibacillus plantarum]QGX69472.1 DUF1642 domain-containing protein [Lactiplantibacillus plantarum]